MNFKSKNFPVASVDRKKSEIIYIYFFYGICIERKSTKNCQVVSTCTAVAVIT